MKHILKISVIMSIVVLAAAFFIDNVVGFRGEDRKTIACVDKCDNAQDKCYSSANKSCDAYYKCDIKWRECLKKCGYTEKDIDDYIDELEEMNPKTWPCS